LPNERHLARAFGGGGSRIRRISQRKRTSAKGEGGRQPADREERCSFNLEKKGKKRHAHQKGKRKEGGGEKHWKEREQDRVFAEGKKRYPLFENTPPKEEEKRRVYYHQEGKKRATNRGRKKSPRDSFLGKTNIERNNKENIIAFRIKNFLSVRRGKGRHNFSERTYYQKGGEEKLSAEKRKKMFFAL